jgi:multiple sugar transport system permease protein
MSISIGAKPADQTRVEPRRRSAFRRRQEIEGLLCILPWLIGFICFKFGPMVASLVIGMMRWDALQPPRWIGLENFQTMINDDRWYSALYNTAYLSFLSVPAQLLVAFLFALILNEKLRAMPLFRTIFYLPSQTPLVATAFLWTWIYHPDFGLANALLTTVGLSPQNWLFDLQLAKPSLILITLWSGIGVPMIIFLAGLQGVPQSLYEAAEIDGAGAFARFRNVTLPMVSPVLFFNLIIGIIASFQGFFTIVFLTTGGGPVYATLIYVVYIYFRAFQDFKMGYAAALAWVLFLIIMVMTAIQFILARRWVYYEGSERS